MAEIHAGYFLVGVLIFAIYRLIETTEKLKGKELPRKDGSIVFQYLLGGVFLLCAVNIVQYMSVQPPELQFLILSKILPLIIFLISVVLFGCIAFMAPSKNFLIALSIGTIVTIVTAWILLYFVETVIIVEGYTPIIKIALSVFGGIGVGVGSYLVLWKINSSGNTRLWEAKSFWKKINNRKFLIPFIILVGIETWMQMQLESILTIFL